MTKYEKEARQLDDNRLKELCRLVRQKMDASDPEGALKVVREIQGLKSNYIVSEPIEGFDLVLVNEALNSCVNIFNLYSGFLAYFTPKLAY